MHYTLILPSSQTVKINTCNPEFQLETVDSSKFLLYGYGNVQMYNQIYKKMAITLYMIMACGCTGNRRCLEFL